MYPSKYGGDRTKFKDRAEEVEDLCDMKKPGMKRVMGNGEKGSGNSE